MGAERLHVYELRERHYVPGPGRAYKGVVSSPGGPLEVGTVVLMEGKGAGRVVEANLDLKSFKLELDQLGEIRVGFKAAGKLLQPLPEEHFLYRKIEAPDELTESAAGDPSGALRQLLESFDRPLVAGEIRQAVAGLVGERQWTSWWAAARKHPQVVTSGSGPRQTYRWAASGDEADRVVRDRFAAADVVVSYLPFPTAVV